MVAEYTAARVKREFRQMGGIIMASVEELETAINGQWEVLAPAVADVQAKLRSLAEQVANGVSSDRLGELIADVNASTSEIAQGLANAMQDTTTPDPTVPVPNPENPLPTDASTETQPGVDNTPPNVDVEPTTTDGTSSDTASE
jgi:hypothetical protein